MNCKDYYMVKYTDVETEECFLTNYVHTNNVQSLLLLLSMDDGETTVKLNDIYYKVVNKYFVPSHYTSMHNILYVEVEEL